MIKRLSITNYKSIKKLDMTCKRVNVFIGEPNSGKSNILEALTFFSQGATDDKEIFAELFRFNTVTDLFYDFQTSNPIEVKTDLLSFKLQYRKTDQGAITNSFEGIYSRTVPKKKAEVLSRFNIDHHTNINTDHKFSNFPSPFRTYVYKSLRKFRNMYLPHLSPPFGDNIPSLIQSNPKFKQAVGNIFKEKGFRLNIKPIENEIQITKEVDEELYSYPYYAISETLQRLVFLTLAFDSNENAVLVMDEPESNTFPYYTKYIAERIARTKSNQFFLTTHNPYVLNSLIEKTPAKDINVFITRMVDFKTTVNMLTPKDLTSVLDQGSDVFFNLDRF